MRVTEVSNLRSPWYGGGNALLRKAQSFSPDPLIIIMMDWLRDVVVSSVIWTENGNLENGLSKVPSWHLPSTQPSNCNRRTLVDSQSVCTDKFSLPITYWNQ